MLRTILLMFLLSLWATILHAQYDLPEAHVLREKTIADLPDSVRVKAYIDLAAFYIFQDNRLSAYSDSAAVALKKAFEIADRAGNKRLVFSVSAMSANHYAIRGQWKHGNELSKKVIDYYNSQKEFKSTADSYHQFAKSIDDTTQFYHEQKLKNLDSARSLYTWLKLPVKIAETLQDIALSEAKHFKFDTAEAIMKQVIKIYRPIDRTRMLNAYDVLARITDYQSDQHKQLKYRLELIEEMESGGDTIRAAYYYSQLATAYANISMYEESLAHILKAISLEKQNKEYNDIYGDLSLAIFDYIQLGKPEEALNYLLATKSKVPPQDLAHTVDLNDMLGKCYLALHNYEKAEHHFLTMMKLFEQTKNTSLYDTEEQKVIDFVHYNQVIGNFYVTRNQFRKAGSYYKRILDLPHGKVRPITLAKVHLMQFRVDSAAKDFIPAINHYIRHKQLQDSLFYIARSQQLQELKIKYETVKQVKDLQLKQQNIASLTAQTKLQDAELKRESFTRNIIIISALVLLTVSYLGYRFKRRHNYRLQAQQQEINAQNTQLRELLEAQKHLVDEKEWLLKEVHHRVKNNLHTIISLLETQATFLTDDALDAIRNSQYRVYAMSLLHQKLYQVENSTQINMAVYLPELLQYLQDSFGVGSRIYFRTNYEDVELDITQAIALGLIFNEAITNAIKYAFPGNGRGIIEISITNDKDGSVCLSISDDGVGISKNWKDKMTSSLGLKLMQGLTDDIQGNFIIENNIGTKISVVFHPVSSLHT